MTSKSPCPSWYVRLLSCRHQNTALQCVCDANQPSLTTFPIQQRVLIADFVLQCLLARSSPLVILFFCSLDVFRTGISKSILSLSPPVISVLVWLILDGLKKNIPVGPCGCGCSWPSLRVRCVCTNQHRRACTQVRPYEKLTRQYEPRSFTRAHSSSNSLALL